MSGAPVRRGTAEDARAAALLHVQGINTGFLSSLGPGFLAHLYRCVARHRGSFLLVYEGPGPEGVAGFLAGTLSTPRLYTRFILTEGPMAAASAWRPLLRQAGKVFETLSYGRSKPGATAAQTDGPLPQAELLSMAVAPEARQAGVGRALVEEFQAELARRGAAQAKVVAGSDNVAANRLYQACGFRPASVLEVHGGRQSNVLRWP